MIGSNSIRNLPLFCGLSYAESHDTARTKITFADRWKRLGREFAQELFTLYAALKHPRVPWYAKACAAGAVAYAVSPVTLIPDWIPVIGQMDNLLALLSGSALMRRMIPHELLETCRQQAQEVMDLRLPHKRIVPILVIFSWAFSLVLAFVLLRQFW